MEKSAEKSGLRGETWEISYLGVSRGDKDSPRAKRSCNKGLPKEVPLACAEHPLMLMCSGKSWEYDNGKTDACLQEVAMLQSRCRC